MSLKHRPHPCHKKTYNNFLRDTVDCNHYQKCNLSLWFYLIPIISFFLRLTDHSSHTKHHFLFVKMHVWNMNISYLPTKWLLQMARECKQMKFLEGTESQNIISLTSCHLTGCGWDQLKSLKTFSQLLIFLLSLNVLIVVRVLCFVWWEKW